MAWSEADIEQLQNAVRLHRQTLEDLIKSHRDFGLLLGDAEFIRPSAWLSRLVDESTDEAERLFKSGCDAREALGRLGFRGLGDL